MNRLCGTVLLLALTQAAQASGREGVDQQPVFDPGVLTEGFFVAHPDLRWQRDGMYAYERGDYRTALKWFKRAARHADKLSQAMIAAMYWEGIGVPRDRALAYAWMDVAAERLYPELIVFRERYWMQLNQAERADAIQRGQAILAEYGDEAAKPRQEEVMDRQRRKVTGSRVGFVGQLKVSSLTGSFNQFGTLSFANGFPAGVSGDLYYADEYWRAEEYWALRDEAWVEPPRERVEVGDLEKVEDNSGDGDPKR